MLDLSFAALAGRVLLTCNEAMSPHLQRLRSRFASASSISNQAFDIALDDLLLNLRELADWPESDADVQWQQELLRVVYTNAADSAVLETQLASSLALDSGLVDTAFAHDALLTAFQKRDLVKLLSLSHGANFSVPGAGKTRVTLAAYASRRARGLVSRMLVVCPKSAFESWKDEAVAYFGVDALRLAVMDSSVVPSAELVLLNYERLPDAVQALIQLLQSQPTFLVLDEAHRMKLGPAGAWGTACFAMGPYASSRMILTGTPAPNGARDLENLLSFVWPGLGRQTVQKALADGDLRKASVRLRPLFVRTTKQELSLPPVSLSVRLLELPPLHRELYQALIGQHFGAERGGEYDAAALGRVVLYLLMAATTPALLAVGSSRYEPLPYRVPPLSPPPTSSLGELMRDLPHYEMAPKYQEVLTIVAANAAKGRKTIVWSTFVRNLTSLHHLLHRFQPAMVHGGTEDRAGELARFRADANCLVLLSNPATLGEGVSLHQVCNDAVFVDRDFAAGRFLQSLDRIHRLGLPPDAETHVTILLSRSTIDEVVASRLSSKLVFMGSVLDDQALLELDDLDEEPSALVGMNADDVSALLAHLSGNAAA